MSFNDILCDGRNQPNVRHLCEKDLMVRVSQGHCVLVEAATLEEEAIDIATVLWPFD